jgi:hypothetical protein
MASDETKVSHSHIERCLLLTSIEQELILKTIDLGRVRLGLKGNVYHLLTRSVDCLPLRLGAVHYLHWLYSKQSSAFVNKVS